MHDMQLGATNTNQSLQRYLSEKEYELWFIREESAVMGRLKGCIGVLVSMLTTLF